MSEVIRTGVVTQIATNAGKVKKQASKKALSEPNENPKMVVATQAGAAKKQTLVFKNARKSKTRQ